MLSHINVGCGGDLTIGELAQLIATKVGFRGRIEFDPGKPDGTLRKLLDVSRLRSLGWRPRVSLTEDLALTYEDFLGAGGTVRSA